MDIFEHLKRRFFKILNFGSGVNGRESLYSASLLPIVPCPIFYRTRSQEASILKLFGMDFFVYFKVSSGK